MADTRPEILLERLPIEDFGEVLDTHVRELAEHWRFLHREAGRIPVWDVSFPLKVARVASRSMLYEFQGTEIFIKIIGEECREFIGLSKSNGKLYDLIPTVNADDIRNRILTCAEQRAPNYCLKSMSWNRGRSYLHYEALFLPFTRPDEQDCSLFYTSMSFHQADQQRP